MILRQSSPSTTTSETITAYWEVFTVGTLTSGTIAVGQQFEDGGSVTSNTCVIWANLTVGNLRFCLCESHAVPWRAVGDHPHRLNRACDRNDPADIDLGGRGGRAWGSLAQ